MSSYVITDEVPYQDPHSRGTGSIVTERKGYILRTRGEHNRLVRHDYRCPEHGLFEALVPSDAVPDAMPCISMDHRFINAIDHGPWSYCNLPSPYQPPTVAQGLAAGKVKC